MPAAGELSYSLEVWQDGMFTLTQNFGGRSESEWMGIGRLSGGTFIFERVRNGQMPEHRVPSPLVDAMGVGVQLGVGFDGALRLTARFGNGLSAGAPRELPMIFDGATAPQASTPSSGIAGSLRPGTYFASARDRNMPAAGELSYSLEVWQDGMFTLTQNFGGRSESEWMGIGRLSGGTFIFERVRNGQMPEHRVPSPLVDAMGVGVQLGVGFDGALRLTARFGNGLSAGAPRELPMIFDGASAPLPRTAVSSCTGTMPVVAAASQA